jgi:ActR/RegA family two-component response regulator
LITQNRILVIDDDPSWQELLTESIEAAVPQGAAVTVATSLEEGRALLDRRHFHLVFVDLRLREDERELTGKILAQKIIEMGEGTCCVIVSGHADVATAVQALRDWSVLDLVLKDEWTPGKIAALVENGLAQARLSYRSRYESGLDLLRRGEDLYGWTARVLDLFAPANEVDRPDRRLADFLNRLLDGLHPLLPLKEGAGLQLDPALRIATAQFWSKALGCPITLTLSRTRGFDAQTAAGLGFNHAVRVLEEPALGLVGAISAPAVPDFAAFAARP